MAKSWNRTETWIALMVLGAGGLILGIAGLWIFMSATAAPLHPNVQDVPSATRSAPSTEWAGAVTRARERVRAELAAQNLPGLSVAVGNGGEILWAEGFGWADLEKRVKVEPHTRFRIGTASIPLTAAAVGLLLEKNRLELDQEIQAYVPEFPRQPWPVTLRQVMGHTAGIGSDGGDEGPLFSQHCDRPVDAFPHFASRDLRFEPGAEYRYSRFGWILVSAAIEAVARKPFLTFMQTQIFEPLGMDDTATDSPADTNSDQATPYFPRFAADPKYGPDLMRPLNLSCYAGSSAFASTPSDLVRFLMAVAGGTFLQPETVRLLHTSQRTNSGADTGYGLGWDLENVTLAGKSATVVGHDGDVLGGIVSTLMILPDGTVVAVTSNTSYADTPGIALKIAEAFAER